MAAPHAADGSGSTLARNAKSPAPTKMADAGLKTPLKIALQQLCRHAQGIMTQFSPFFRSRRRMERRKVFETLGRVATQAFVLEIVELPDRYDCHAGEILEDRDESNWRSVRSVHSAVPCDWTHAREDAGCAGMRWGNRREALGLQRGAHAPDRGDWRCGQGFVAFASDGRNEHRSSAGSSQEYGRFCQVLFNLRQRDPRLEAKICATDFVLDR
jgi:hypothetical protein